MFRRFFRWADTFKGAMFMALFCLFAIFASLSGDTPNITLGVLNGFCVVYWVWRARLALKNEGTHESNVKLTDDQEQRIETATEDFHAVVKEIELELKRAVREQANVQSNQRTDQEAGKEGTDGRTDSKEDRTPR